VGLLRRAGPSDVQAIPRRRGLLVRLLRRLQRRELRPRAGVLRRNRQRPSKRHRRGGCRRRRGSSCSGNWTAPGCGAKRPSPLTAEGVDINAQLAQARELEAKLAEEYRTVRLLRTSITGEASACGERASELGRQAHDRINADFNVDNPDTPPRASQKLIAAATLLRAMSAPSTPEARNLRREAQALIQQAAIQQAESSASRIRQEGSARDDGGVQGPEPSVHAGGAAERLDNPGRTPAKERLLDTRGQAQDGDARNVINARRTSNAEARAAAGYHPRRGGCYNSGEDRSLTPEPPGTRVFSREIRTATFPSASASPRQSSSTTGRRTPVCGSTTTV
jgi:hypothetical protein